MPNFGGSTSLFESPWRRLRAGEGESAPVAVVARGRRGGKPYLPAAVFTAEVTWAKFTHISCFSFPSRVIFSYCTFAH